MKSRSILFMLGGVAAGAIVGMLFAPQSGRKTRAAIKDKSVKFSHDVADVTGKKSRHIANKAKGYAHNVKGLVGRKQVSEEAERTEAMVGS
jgi:gas vesicle protein